MADRNGYAENAWGRFCRGIQDFFKVFDLGAMQLAALMTIMTCLMAGIELITRGEIYTTPEWWVGAAGHHELSIYFLMIVALLGKHTVGYGIASRWNSPKGMPPGQVVAPEDEANPAPAKPGT